MASAFCLGHTAPLKASEPRGFLSSRGGFVTSVWQRGLGHCPCHHISPPVEAAGGCLGLQSQPALLGRARTAAESLQETLLQLLTCSGSLIASAHPSPLRFLLLPPALQQEGGLRAPAPVPGGQRHRGALAGNTGELPEGTCMEGRGKGLGGKHPAMGWDKWVELKGKGFGGMRRKKNK